jgi:16S rRNA (guanine1207-N2)-methyltransferase
MAGLRPVDRVLVGALPTRPPRFILTGLDPRGALGMSARARHPDSRVAWFHFDLHPAGVARSRGLDPDLIVVAADLPCCQDPGLPSDAPTRPDLVALPFPRGGEALLARELIEEAHDALAAGGRLLAATDGNPAWLRGAIRDVFRNVEATASEEGTVVHATRTREAAALKDHGHVARLAVGARELRFRTRPGVFSYGHVDQGSKALLAVADLSGVRRVLDLGCGVGVLGIAAASLAPGASAVLVDSNVRAVALARENAALNAVERVEAVATADPAALDAGAFDCALANPPYFGGFAIAERFVDAAHRALVPGGRLWLVAKAANEHADVVRARFGDATIAHSGGYGVISAVR